MNLVHVTPTYYSANSVIGGGEKYIIYMIHALSLAAAKANMPMVNSILSFGKDVGDHVLNENIRCRVIDGVTLDAHSILVDELMRQIGQADVVIVHQCLTAFGLFVASHAQLAGKYVVGMDHGGGEHQIVSHSHEGAGMYNAFWAYSEFGSNAFAGLGVRTIVARGPVDTKYYRPDLTIDKDPVLVVAVGRLLPHKGFDRIIKSMPAKLKLVIAGRRSDEDYFRYLKELQSKSAAEVDIREGLDDPQIRVLMQRASLFIHASTHTDYLGRYYAKPELLGLAPLEALACGTPALVSVAGALNELSVIEGVRTFTSDDELSALLISHALNEGGYPTANAIHASVDAAYGISQFGDCLYAELMARSQTQ